MSCPKSLVVSHQSCFSFRFLRLRSVSNLWLFCSRVSLLRIECYHKKKKTFRDHHLKRDNGKSKTGLSSSLLFSSLAFFPFNLLSILNSYSSLNNCSEIKKQFSFISFSFTFYYSFTLAVFHFYYVCHVTAIFFRLYFTRCFIITLALF